MNLSSKCIHVLFPFKIIIKLRARELYVILNTPPLCTTNQILQNNIINKLFSLQR